MSLLPSSTSAKRNVAIYVRVSTQEQKQDGHGLEAQKRQILDYIQRNETLGLTLNGTEADWCFEDIHTGAEIIRPSLQRLLKKVRETKQFDTIIVWKLDRLSRRLQDHLDIFDTLQQHGVSLISISENIDFKGAIGTLIFQMFGAIGEFERSLILSRTRSGLIASASMGNFTGTSVPFGYTAVRNPSGKGKKLTINSEEKEWVQKIFHWYVYEGLGCGQIADRLNDLKVNRGQHEKRKRSPNWTVRVVESVLKNTVYTGEFVANKTDAEGCILPRDEWTVVEIPPCINEILFILAAEKRRERKSKISRKNVYPLAGLLVDMTMHKPRRFKGKPNTKGSGRSYNRSKMVHPITGEVYPNFSLPAHAVEDHIWQRIREAFHNPQAFIKARLAEYASASHHPEHLENELKRWREKKATIDTAIARIEHAYETGAYPLEKMQEKKGEMNDERVQIDRKIDSLEQEMKSVALLDEQEKHLETISQQFTGNLDSLTQTQKKILMQYFIERIEVTRTKIEGKKRLQPVLTVFFRFLPSDCMPNIEGGEPKKALHESNESVSEYQTNASGGRCVIRSNLLRHTFTIVQVRRIIAHGITFKEINVKVAIPFSLP